MLNLKPDALSQRINKLPKWARDYIHQVVWWCKFVTAELYDRRHCVLLSSVAN